MSMPLEADNRPLMQMFNSWARNRPNEFELRKIINNRYADDIRSDCRDIYEKIAGGLKSTVLFKVTSKNGLECHMDDLGFLVPEVESRLIDWSIEMFLDFQPHAASRIYMERFKGLHPKQESDQERKSFSIRISDDSHGPITYYSKNGNVISMDTSDYQNLMKITSTIRSAACQ